MKPVGRCCLMMSLRPKGVGVTVPPPGRSEWVVGPERPGGLCSVDSLGDGVTHRFTDGTRASEREGVAQSPQVYTTESGPRAQWFSHQGPAPMFLSPACPPTSPVLRGPSLKLGGDKLLLKSSFSFKGPRSAHLGLSNTGSL